MQNQREAGAVAVAVVTTSATGRMAGGSARGRPGRGGCSGARSGAWGGASGTSKAGTYCWSSQQRTLPGVRSDLHKTLGMWV